MFAYPFMVNALEAGTIVSLIAAIAGWFMVLRRQAFAGHTLAVMSFPGASAAALAGIPLAVGYFASSAAAAIAISAGSHGRNGRDPAVTSLCVMAFLSAGHVPGEGPYGDTVWNGVRFVLDSQRSNGLFTPDTRGPYEMYYQGICTLMLAEAAGMLPERRDARLLKAAIERAVLVILQAQRKAGDNRGGWRYNADYTNTHGGRAHGG